MMKSKFTLLIVSLALILGFSDSIWGQIGVLRPEYQPNTNPQPVRPTVSSPQIDLRRADAPGIDFINNSSNPDGYTNVNNEFGAGESSNIRNNAITDPDNQSLINDPVLRLGSNDSKNIMINTYNAGGYASGWLEIAIYQTACTSSSTSGWATANIPGEGIVNLMQGYGSTSASTWVYGSLSSQGGSLGSLSSILAFTTRETASTVTLYMTQHGQQANAGGNGDGTYTFNKVPHFTPYASTAVPFTTPSPALLAIRVDDGVQLVQYAGDKLVSSSANPGIAPVPASGSSDPLVQPYKRPTTVSIEESNTFAQISFSDVNWWYQRHEILPYQSTGLYYQTTNQAYKHVWNCCHYDGNNTNGTPTVPTRPMTIDVTTVPNWTDYAPVTGDTYLDAAVQLLDGAIVCVKGDVMDMTGNIDKGAQADDAAYLLTNALITVPVNDRFTLRTKGDYQVNMYHEANSASNVFYTAANFPNPSTEINLSAGTVNQPIGMLLKSYNDSRYNSINTVAPYTGTVSSIFGVNGDYLFAGKMADIHTDFPADYDSDNKGVIEVGSRTAGKSHFHIYSNGMLKNYEGCDIDTNFPMYFGKDGMAQYGDMPQLEITTNEALYLVNFGNLTYDKCAAELSFHTTSVDEIKAAFGGDGAGPLQIQALSHVSLNADGVWDASTNGNNIYILSDGGNITTQKLDITSDYIDAYGQGHVTIWAETDPKTDCFENTEANRFSESGNIYLNDDVSITRTATDAAEINIIAANNIRTASLTTNNTDENDVTNIISYKGDIYLGYSAGVNVYTWDGTTEAYPKNGKTGNANIFTYKGTGDTGTLNIFAGYDDPDSGQRYNGGNIYITRMNVDMAGTAHATNVMIPFSNEYRCSVDGRLHARFGDSMQQYEHAGIILGAGRCGKDNALAASATAFSGALVNPTTALALNNISGPSIEYSADEGELVYDAGTRGNIINNTGAIMSFNDANSNAFFRTRSGDIDMRGETNVDGLSVGKGLVFLADNGNANKALIGCDCEEESNNVYMQDFDFATFVSDNDGSVYFGADNNIKLQYGGLRDIGTWRDPFLSDNWGYGGGGVLCSANYHCDSDSSVNKARPMILDYTGKTTGGVGVVASDMIDVYKRLIYTGGSTAGMLSVPAKTGTANGITSPGGTLHGENVAGYGLYIKTQGNKKNWSVNPFAVLDICAPQCPADACGSAFLHQVARVTFHDDARIYAENSKVYIGSPVLEVYGNLELNTTNGATKTNQSLHIQTDSLILHDSLILDGNKWRLSTWSNLYRNMPVIKLGHQRFTPPTAEDYCKLCFSHTQGGNIANRTALDTMVVTFRNDAGLPRLHTLVADHTVLTFLTDSFDHQKGNPTLNAKIFTDTFKIRNQVELWTSNDKTHDGHFELVSEIQMGTKDYAGIFARHLHMEPIAPDCGSEKYSELWPSSTTLDVISTATFGGFGILHANVYVETAARIAPGYASLGVKGNCYEQGAGTLKMRDLRMDNDAQLHYSIGEQPGLGGELADCIDVDKLILRGNVHVYVEKRCDQYYIPGCYPIIRYKSVEVGALNNLKLATLRIDGVNLSLDFSEEGVVNLCVATPATPLVQREVILPQPPHGVSIFPFAGVHYVPWGNDFRFTLNYYGREEFEVYTDRASSLTREVEVLTGIMNANGEHEYILKNVKTEPIHIYIGPNTVGNESLDKAAVWSSGNTLYIRVSREDIASIYSVAGTLVNRIEVPEGGITLPLSRGAYIVTLKNGSVHKVIIR